MCFIAFYGRLGGDEQFKCTMTTAAPNVKESWLLHPTVRHILFDEMYLTTATAKTHHERPGSGAVAGVP